MNVSLVQKHALQCSEIAFCYNLVSIKMKNDFYYNEFVIIKPHDGGLFCYDVLGIGIAKLIGNDTEYYRVSLGPRIGVSCPTTAIMKLIPAKY